MNVATLVLIKPNVREDQAAHYLVVVLFTLFRPTIMSHLYIDCSHLLPKLNGSANYESWHLLVSATLAAGGVSKFIDDTAVGPPVQDPEESDYQFQVRREAYYAQDAHARMLIVSTCKPQIQTTLARVVTAKGCWEKLKSQYCSYASKIVPETLQAWRNALDAEDCCAVKRLLGVEEVENLEKSFKEEELKEKELKRLLGIREELLNLGWEADGQAWVKLRDVCEKRPRTALHVAARRGDLKLMENILGMAATDGAHEGTDADRDVCPNSTNCHLLKIVNGDYDLDALAIAVVNGNRDAVNLLKKASLRCRTEKVLNPYHIDQDAEEEDEDGKPSDQSDDVGSDPKGKTIYESVEDRSSISALSKVTNQVLTALKADELLLIKQLYNEDCDFNFLPMSVYLFHFTFSIWSTKKATMQMEECLRKTIPQEFCKALGVPSKVSPPGQTTVFSTDLVNFLFFRLWDGQGRTALHVAVDSCSVNRFIDILPPPGAHKDLDGNYLNIHDSVGRTPLYRAAAIGDSIVVKVLLADARTDVRAKVEYHTDRWGHDLDIDKLSRSNFFESDCVYITKKKIARKKFNTKTRAVGGPGPNVKSLLTASSTALHVAIIHKHEPIVKLLLHPKEYLPENDPDPSRRSQIDDTCYRRFNWPVIRDDNKYYVQGHVSALQLSVLVGNSTILQVVWKEDEKERRQGMGSLPSFHLAAAIGNPDAIKAFLDNGQDPLKEDDSGNTALHHALGGKYVKFHPHIVDFVSCNHVFSWRRESDADVSAWLAKPEGTNLLGTNMDKRTCLAEPLDPNPLGEDMDKQTGKSEVEQGIGQRQGTINLLLQAGIDIWKRNNKERTARPLSDAQQDFVTWWYDKVAQQTQQVQEKLNAAANAISVTAALVATASYLGPFQPPLGYGTDAVHVDILAVRIFVSCNNLSFYFALAAIMFALLPSLPMPDESSFKELHKTRIMVAVALLFLLPSVALVLTAFAASYIAVIPDRGLAHHSLLLSTTVGGGIFCLLAIIRFGFRLANVLITLPKDRTNKITFFSEFVPLEEMRSLAKNAESRISKSKKIERFKSFMPSIMYKCSGNARSEASRL